MRTSFPASLATPRTALGGLALCLAIGLTGCGGPDLGGGNNSSFNNGLSGNYSGYGNTPNGQRPGTAGNAGIRGRGTYARFETTFELSDVKGNVFDFAENDVQVTFTRPDNQNVKVPAFFDGGANGKIWRVRYTPDMTGKHTLARFSLNGREVQPEKIEKRDFDVTGSAQPGFIHRDPKDKTHFAFDNGNSYYPQGHNVAWLEKPEEYASTFEKMGKAGENWSRLWVTHFDGKNPDWSHDPKAKAEPGVLNLEVAKQWDALFDAAEKNGIYFQMTLQHHGQYSTKVNPNWDTNPWNKKNGGWLTAPDEFFTNPRAIAATKAKYRYLIARYGYSPNLMAWELFNEVEWTDAVAHKHADEVAAWHTMMVDFLHKQDPYHHLVTSSSGMDTAMLGRDLDYWQIHAYPSDPVSALALDTRKLDRPVFFGEIGAAGNGELSASDERAFLHRVLWASMMSEMGGGAQYWGWQAIEKHKLYDEFKSAGDFLKQSGLPSRHNLPATPISVETPDRGPLSLSPGAGWGTAKQTEFTVLPGGTVEGISAMPAYLQGNGHRAMFPSATFKTTYPEAGTFAVTVGAVAQKGAHLTISIDGTVAAEKDFKAGDKDSTVNATIEAKVGVGAHTIKVENTGEEWLTVQRLTLTPYAPSLGAIGKSGKEFAAVWLYNRSGKSEGAKGKITIPGLASGNYKATWYDSEAGKSATEETAAATGSGLTLSTPAIVRDMAVYVTRSNEKGEKAAAKPGKEKKGKSI